MCMECFRLSDIQRSIFSLRIPHALCRVVVFDHACSLRVGGCSAVVWLKSCFSAGIHVIAWNCCSLLISTCVFWEGGRWGGGCGGACFFFFVAPHSPLHTWFQGESEQDAVACASFPCCLMETNYPSSAVSFFCFFFRHGANLNSNFNGEKKILFICHSVS